MKIHHTILLFLAIACQPTAERQESSSEPTDSGSSQATEVRSFMGSVLEPKELSEEIRSKYELNLKKAKEALDADPDSLDLIIWYGRRLAYLGRHLEAIQVYTDGLSKYPNSYRLRRHRGHRYITTRQLELAIKDYEDAAFHSTGKPNRIEPDGLPNKLNQPLGNDKFNIFYHYGLAHYLNGRFDKAVSAYNKCMEYSDNNDLKVATSYWLYMSARRVGNEDLSDKTLNEISEEMVIIENTAYLDLLMLFKGKKTVEELMELASTESGALNPTLAYGIGNWHLMNGRVDEGRNVFWKALESPHWDAFGYIATEADINNLATSN